MKTAWSPMRWMLSTVLPKRMLGFAGSRAIMKVRGFSSQLLWEGQFANRLYHGRNLPVPFRIITFNLQDDLGRRLYAIATL